LSLIFPKARDTLKLEIEEDLRSLDRWRGTADLIGRGGEVVHQALNMSTFMDGNIMLVAQDLPSSTGETRPGQN